MNKELAELRSSIVQIKVGSRVFDAVKDPHCKVCQHPARFQIETKILHNFGWSAIARFVSDLNHQKTDGSIEDWYELSSAQIKAHADKGHIPIEGQMLRTLSEERAAQLGIDLSTSTTQFVDHVVTQRAILARGYELMMDGKIEPDVKDTLAAAKALGEIEKDDNNASTEDQWREFMGIYFSVVQGIVTREQWQEIATTIQGHPIFQAMKSNRQAIEEAEVVE